MASVEELRQALDAEVEEALEKMQRAPRRKRSSRTLETSGATPGNEGQGDDARPLDPVAPARLEEYRRLAGEMSDSVLAQYERYLPQLLAPDDDEGPSDQGKRLAEAARAAAAVRAARRAASVNKIQELEATLAEAHAEAELSEHRILETFSVQFAERLRANERELLCKHDSIVVDSSGAPETADAGEDAEDAEAAKRELAGFAGEIVSMAAAVKREVRDFEEQKSQIQKVDATRRHLTPLQQLLANEMAEPAGLKKKDEETQRLVRETEACEALVGRLRQWASATA